MTTLPSATVAILSWNGEKYLDAILTAVENQDYDGTVEILVIDSGSTDGTLGIVAAHPVVRLHEIPNSEFGHGRTRDLAARLATGDIVAYLTHDAVPIGPHWLDAIVAPMADDPRISAVMGKQVPRAGCYPLLKYEIRGVFRGLGPDFGTTVFYDNGTLLDEQAVHAAAFYSDVNAAARRSVLTGEIPYRDVSYAEDQLFGRDLIAAGHRKAYAPAAAVEHSNDLTLRQSGERIVEEVVGLRRIGTVILPPSLLGAFKLALRGALVDFPRIATDRDFGLLAKIGWTFANPVYHLVKWTSYRRATRLPLQ